MSKSKLDLLKVMLQEYKTKYEELVREIYPLMRSGDDWRKLAKEAAGYKLMIDQLKSEIKDEGKVIAEFPPTGTNEC